MSTSKESQSYTHKCPFCEVPCYHKHCEYSQEYLKKERKKYPFMNWSMERLQRWDSMIRDQLDNIKKRLS